MIRMTRNEAFCAAVKDILSRYEDGLLTVDLYPLVKDRIPNWCQGNWKHDVQNAQQFLKERGHLTVELVPGYERRYRWKVVS